MTSIRGRYFACDCGGPWHALHVGPFSGETMSEAELGGGLVTITLLVEPASWRERLHAAILALGGRRFNWHEMIIARNEWPDFVAHINEIDTEHKRVQAKWESAKHNDK